MDLLLSALEDDLEDDTSMILMKMIEDDTSMILMKMTEDDTCLLTYLLIPCSRQSCIPVSL